MNMSVSTLIEVVIPVYNEEAQLQDSVETLRSYLAAALSDRWRITIADNASTDRTWEIAHQLRTAYPEVQAVHLTQKGRGRALQQTWLASDADIVAYMDVDLSTGLNALPLLVKPLVDGTGDVAIGSRLTSGSMVTRSLTREVLSRSYNLLIKSSFFNHFSDAQCGFKAMRTSVARQLLPLVEDRAWFWDTELLLLAEHNTLRISEVPVSWVEGPDTRVKLGQTIWEDIKGLWRMRLLFWRGGGHIVNRKHTPRVATHA